MLYRKKNSDKIRAVKFDGTAECLDSFPHNDMVRWEIHFCFSDFTSYLYIDMNDGEEDIKVKPGDWIVCTDVREYKCYDNTAFVRLFEPVDEKVETMGLNGTTGKTGVSDPGLSGVRF